MNKSLLLTATLLILGAVSAYGQRSVWELFYADVNLGTNILFDENGANAQWQFGLGYRVSDRHAFGLSYHWETAGNAYSYSGIKGIGLDWRYANPGGLILKAGLGKVIDGWQAIDTAEQFEYRSSKLFTDFSMAYQIRPGFTFGVYLTMIPEIVFDTYRPEQDIPPYTSDSEEYVRTGTDREAFTNIGISLGFAFPPKPKRKKKKRKKDRE